MITKISKLISIMDDIMVDILELKKLGSELSILYAEDDLNLQNEVSTYLKKFFKYVEVVNDGLEGLNAFKSFSSRERKKFL